LCGQAPLLHVRKLTMASLQRSDALPLSLARFKTVWMLVLLALIAGAASQMPGVWSTRAAASCAGFTCRFLSLIAL
jgi:hypothetical protein